MPEFFPNPVRDFDVALGRLEHVSGSFGRFEVTVADYRPLEPAGRGNLTFAPPQARAVSECDLILDLSGGPALFAPHQKRDGYLRADPGDPLALQRAAFDAAQMTGTFEKTLFVRTDASLCAHSRAQQQGCTRCLDACPTGAITPNGDAIAVDPRICAGCAGCSAVCPSGAVSFDAPGATEIFADIRKLGQIYRAAGGKAAHLLVHDDTYGREMISLAARFGRGLPAHVLPLELPALAAFGHAEIMVALASGFGAITLLLSPQTERGVIETEVRLATDIARHLDCAAAHIQIFDVHDPDALSAALYDTQTPVLAVKSVLPLGTRRAATRLAARAQAPENARATPIPLAPGAPYGNVRIDTDACTLCLACAALCPSGALSDNPDYPQLLFREDACLQCGLCTHVCPENALVLEPRLDLSDAALSGRVLKQEEPYHCIECGTPFGVKSTIERIVAKLEGQHAMFASGQQGRLIRMCSDCRVRAQYHENNAPFRMGDRPRVRTTDDYLDPSKKR